ncbi:alpha-galactosidase [Candidatus Villigracilis affinis]|uniref:alpha-galactosidase n=1 Tax=Candidatus Villigracilis affinis TaxID=3140682 RepID=UPI002A210EB8|nr:alpha-galactosidase [Anaerolineales bacterium]
MPIHTSPTSWVIETKNTGYAIGLNEAGLLTHRYWRARLPFAADYPAPVNPIERSSFDMPQHYTPEEYPGYSALRYFDPALKITFADGTRDLVLHYVDFSTSASPYPELALHLKDEAYPLSVTLHYRVHEEYDLIARWVTLENLGNEPILIERAFSAKWTLPHGDDYFFSHMFGRHNNEYNMKREVLTPGLKTIESRRLTTSHHHTPWFAIDRNATEDSGEVWFGTFAWSGNWKITAEVTEFASTRISVGLNDWDFAWKLNPAETFVTPESISGYVKDGFGAASRLMHDYVRNILLPHKNQLHKVLYNSWEATLFDVDEISQSKLAEVAAGMGIELFVMDDGWFHNRNLDNAGLGDWFPDKTKFPNGLGGLIKNVNALGMDFGLWVEPEMVNPDSDLYRAHPDWVIHFPSRARTEARRQLILNLGRTDVQEYIISVLTTILSENNIQFIKWDMNRNVSEPGWSDAPGDARELWVRYVQGLYHVWGTLRERFPNVIWQSCSGGGGRADFGILHFADQIWISDNTEATARLSIQEGFSQFLPANTMEAWVTDWGRNVVPLEFRFHVSMCGSLGVGGNLNEWDQADRELAAHCIRLYKEIRPIIQFGDQYRLISPQKSMFSAVQYVSKDQSEAVLFVFRVYLSDPTNLPMIHLRGLNPTALYEVDGYSGPRSGASWMEAGLRVELKNLQSKILKIKQVE